MPFVKKGAPISLSKLLVDVDILEAWQLKKFKGKGYSFALSDLLSAEATVTENSHRSPEKR
ncbi:hypothetical protein M2282_001847 [Variovorax boronicumulans]|uniref:hypothetical protein n=1 Tax=Variovorax boronicumulans TaxID=436515 RepID=UPI0024756EE5|nr:hypothetical protein [Variovorax boronicumulans]MDH6166700.1 hypothetical protein [Variovorax boronicumulans]